jgi:N-acetylmuramoyl-L-alanine amidase
MNQNRTVVALLALTLLLIGLSANQFSRGSAAQRATHVRAIMKAADRRAEGMYHRARPTLRHTQHRHHVVIVLDPGHGGSDAGAVHRLPDGTIDLMEKTVTLEIALRTAASLRHAGYTVYLTRTTDRNVNEPSRDYNHDGVVDNIDELEARVAFANQHHADLFVSIHINGSESADARGLIVYYCPAHPFAAENIRLAQLLDEAIYHQLQHTGYTPANWGIASDVSDPAPQRYPDYPWFFVLGPADKRDGIIANNAVSALGETLYITNDWEAALLHQRRIIVAIAAGYVRGIEQFEKHTNRITRASAR